MFRLIVVTAISLAFLYGCGSTGAASRFEQRRVVGLTSMPLGEYTIPALTLGEGPSLSTFQSKEIPSTISFRGTAATTNTTSALGIYSSTEEKHFRFSGTITVFGTNVVSGVHTAPDDR